MLKQSKQTQQHRLGRELSINKVQLKLVFKEETLSYPNLEHTSSFHLINKNSDVNIYLSSSQSIKENRECWKWEKDPHMQRKWDRRGGERLRDSLQKSHLGGWEKQHRKMKNWETKEKDSWLHWPWNKACICEGTFQSCEL